MKTELRLEVVLTTHDGSTIQDVGADTSILTALYEQVRGTPIPLNLDFEVQMARTNIDA